MLNVIRGGRKLRDVIRCAPGLTIVLGCVGGEVWSTIWQLLHAIQLYHKKAAGYYSCCSWWMRTVDGSMLGSFAERAAIRMWRL
ncbi:hypothetical protein OH77DRAFT_1420776 [Trametes cingulata]|nr:hypothetical protein OH77DRAFT_1420776 [Trametes cingulata]